MKTKKNVLYFPVDSGEQTLLLRVREPDLEGHIPELLEMVDQLAKAHLTPADLNQAIQLLVGGRHGPDLDARFCDLEGRLNERIEKGLAEIEGRMSKRLAGGALVVEPPMPVPPTVPPRIPPPVVVPPPPGIDIMQNASIAFRIGSDVVSGPSAAQFYRALWRWLFEHGHVRITDLPIRSGRKRYTVATTPYHPSGKAFVRPEQPAPGVFVELNISRGDIIRRSKGYLVRYGIAFEVLVGSEG